jgi:3-dehydroquinate synthase
MDRGAASRRDVTSARRPRSLPVWTVEGRAIMSSLPADFRCPSEPAWGLQPPHARDRFSSLRPAQRLPLPDDTPGAAGGAAGSVLQANVFQCESAKSYGVFLLEGLLDPATPLLGDLLDGRRALLVTTPTVARLYGPELARHLGARGLDVSLFVLGCTEQSKSLDLVSLVCDRAVELGMDRRGVLVGMGGGVCTDLVTMAASWIRRGIAHFRIPTTLVGQIDASIGLKGGVNFRGKKNYLGCFYPPEAVLIDPAFLRSLPVGSLRCGLSEIIKMALVRDAQLFDLVEVHAPSFLGTGFAEPREEALRVLWLAAKRMLQELATNPYENQTYQRLVDFGHTFSPLLEAASGFTLCHGEAVAIDMALSAVLAAALGLLPDPVGDRILAVLRSVGLPIYTADLTAALCRDALQEAARHRGGVPNLVLPVAVGSATFLDRLDALPVPLLDRAIQRLAEEASGARAVAS